MEQRTCTRCGDVYVLSEQWADPSICWDCDQKQRLSRKAEPTAGSDVPSDEAGEEPGWKADLTATEGEPPAPASAEAGDASLPDPLTLFRRLPRRERAWRTTGDWTGIRPSPTRPARRLAQPAAERAPRGRIRTLRPDEESTATRLAGDSAEGAPTSGIPADRADGKGELGRQIGPWRQVSSREAYRNPWIRVREDQVVRPDGKPGIYGVVELEPAVGIVALTDDERVYLVGQYRYATECYSWEIVTGFADRGEELVTAAQRELLEETGLSAASWEPLGHCYLSNSVTNQVGYLYLARGLSAGLAAPDETEALAVKTVSLGEALHLAQEGGIDQAYSLVGLHRAWQRLH